MRDIIRIITEDMHNSIENGTKMKVDIEEMVMEDIFKALEKGGGKE